MINSHYNVNPDVAQQVDINEAQATARRQAAQLMRHLHRGGVWAHYWRAADRRAIWFPAGTDHPLPAAWLAEHNVYFTVNPVSDAALRRYNKASTNALVCATNTLFAEFDGKDFIRQDEWLPHYQEPDLSGLSPAKQRGALQKAQTAAIDAAYKLDPDTYKARALAHIEALPVRPSVVVDSGGGYQCYWLLRETVLIDDANRKEIAHVQREWVHLVDGDKSACDLRRVLRVLGSHNVKPRYAPNYPLVTAVWFELSSQYDYADLAAMVPAQPTPTQRTRTYTPPHIDLPEVETVPDLPVTPSVVAYNRETNLRSLLLEIGYTEHPGGRLSRPGGDSGGVDLHPDNTATIYSTADPLFCGRRVRPADVLCIYEFGGDVDATLAHLDHLYAERQATLQAAKLWVRTHSFAHYVPSALQATRWAKDEDGNFVYDAATGERIAAGTIYRTDATDTKVADAILDEMAAQNCLTVTLSDRAIAKRSGVSHRSVPNATARLQGWLFDFERSQDAATTYTLHPDFVAFRLHTHLHMDAEVCKLNATNEYSPRKADEAFLSGTSRTMRAYIAARAREMTVRASWVTPDGQTVVQDVPATPAAVRDQVTIPGLGETLLRVIDALLRCGEMDRQALAQETGKSPSAIATATRRGERLGLLVATQDAPRTPKVYEVFGDVWERIDALRTTMRTYNLSVEREEQDLRNAQLWARRQRDNADAAKRADLDRRITWLGNKRLPLLARLYPDLTQEEIADLAFAPQTPTGPHPSLVAKFRRMHAEARMDVREQRHKEEWEATAQLRSAINQLQAQRVPKRDWVRMLRIAEYPDKLIWRMLSPTMGPGAEVAA